MTRRAQVDRGEVVTANTHAAHLKSQGWLRVDAGDLSRLRAAGKYDDFELASWATGVVREGRLTKIKWELWRRPRAKPNDRSAPAGSERAP